MKYSLLILIIAFFLIVISRYLPAWGNAQASVSQKILGGIVPHHLLVRDIIADFFVELPKENIDNIIILGPNHQEIGVEKIVFNPKFEDQSITALTPFIKSEYPKSKIIPILLKREISLLECRGLADKLLKMPGNNLLLASIDFSHYLPSEDAEANDKEILARIRNRDYEGLLKLNSDYVDSNAALVTALMYYEQRSMNNINILSNTNSGRRGNPYAPTTSYFSIIVYGQN